MGLLWVYFLDNRVFCRTIVPVGLQSREGWTLMMRRVISFFRRQSRLEPRDLLLPLLISSTENIEHKSYQEVATQLPVTKATEFQICECCGNKDMSDNLTKIDSGQLLCLVCLNEFREKYRPENALTLTV